MVEIIRKGPLPSSDEVPESIRAAAMAAAGIVVREPRRVGFPLIFSATMELIEPAVAFLHEHEIQRAHTAETVRTYLEILTDWLGHLERKGILWSHADAVDLVAYRNRMLSQASAHTGRAYSIRTVNHRVRGVLRFYEWAVRTRWLPASPPDGRAQDFSVARRAHPAHAAYPRDLERSIFLIRQFETLPRPLTGEQARELLAQLPTPYDLIARWQLYTGLRVSEALRLKASEVSSGESWSGDVVRVINVLRKGRKSGYVMAPASLLDETAGFIDLHRRSWLKRAGRRRARLEPEHLFINRRGVPVSRNTYQQVMHRAGVECGFHAATHLLRATFACMMLARFERLAAEDGAINPLMIVKVLMGHEHIETTDRYLRAIAVDTSVLSEVLDSLLATEQ